MKKSVVVICLLLVSAHLFAQKEEREKGFKQDQLYIGTGINAVSYTHLKLPTKRIV